MPKRALQPCKESGCPLLVESGRCERHRRKDQQSYYAQRRADPVMRVRDAFYKTAAWIRLRTWRLTIEPLCRRCRTEFQRITAATTADHIKPVAQDWDLRLEPENTQSLCDSCHAYKSAVEGSRWHRAKLPEGL